MEIPVKTGRKICYCFNMKSSPLRVAVVGCILLCSCVRICGAQAIDETQLVMQMRAARDNARGAAPETVRRIAEGVRKQVYLQAVRVNSAVVLNPNVWNANSCMDYAMPCRGAGYRKTRQAYADYSFLGPWTFLARIFEPEDGFRDPCGELGVRYCPSIRPIEREHGVGAESHRSLIAEKDYQTVKLQFYVAYPVDQLDNVRSGQKISFTGRITSLFDHDAAAIVANRIETETQMLRCPNGHEYGPSAGYRFCPIDGKPLN